MLINIYKTTYGNYITEPVSTKWAHKFAKHMEEWTDHHDASAFFQGDYELPETVTQNRQFKALQDGYTITIQIDPWEYGHWLGWDAHTIAE